MSAAEELHKRGVRIEELRAQNAELVAALLEIRWRLQDQVDAGLRLLAQIDAALAKAKPQ